MGKTNIESLDRRTKWGLLLVSLATLALLILAALQENVFPPWKRYREEYAELLREKATDDRERAFAEQFEIGIDHMVVPELKAVDRCITCHVGLDDPRMASEKQPFRTHPGDFLIYHPQESFGCTVCHEGQGRATEVDAAHGHVPHWPRPMLASTFRYATCAKCHDGESLYGDGGFLTTADESSGAAFMARGKDLVNSKGCLGCHVVNGMGGTLGPDISFVGDKTRVDFDFSHFEEDEPRTVSYWLTKHFLEPTEISPGTLMPDMGLSKSDAQDLTAYVLSLRRRDVSAVYVAPIPLDRPPVPPPTGEELYMMACAACHGPSGESSEVPGIRSPALNNVDSLAVASDDYYRHIIDKGRAGSAMPAWGPDSENLSYEEIDRIVRHIRSWEAEGAALGDISAAVGDAAMGRAYYVGLCANCHGRQGQGGIGNTLNSPTFLSVASDAFLAETIVHGRPGTAMASWKHLPSQAVSDLLAYLRTWHATAPTFGEVEEALGSGSHAENVRVGAILYKGNCATCHGSDGEGGIGPRLNSQNILPAVDNEYLYRTITEGRPTTAMPAWRHLSAQDIAALLAYMRSWNGGGPLELEKAPPRGDYSLGEVHYRVSCMACHGEKGMGGVGPQLANPSFLSVAHDDVLYHWIARGRVGTAMKGFLVEEQGPTELTSAHIADIIAYLRHEGTRSERPYVRSGVGNPLLGGQLFKGNCAGCHGVDGEGASGPQLNNPNFLKSASDGFLTATIILGREGTPMRSMIHGQEGLGQIAPDQVQDVIAYMRYWDRPDAWRKPRAVAEMSERAITAGRKSFVQYCSGCHGPNGLGDRDGPGYFAPALNNQEFLGAASDGFLLATIARGRSRTPMRPFGVGAGGIADLSAEDIFDLVSYIRTWQKDSTLQGEASS